MDSNAVYVGYDPRESLAFLTAVHSIRKRLTRPLPIKRLDLYDLIKAGLYYRPTSRDIAGRLIDTLSATADYSGALSTEHANARFLVPFVAPPGGWALFVDGDILALGDVSEIFEGLDPTKALYCVPHRFAPARESKMDNQVQTNYTRKNWSSVMLFNLAHEANKRLTVAEVNCRPGRDLHRFYWLNDYEIGFLEPRWNWLVGHSPYDVVPTIVHFTSGLPDMPGYEHDAFAADWLREREEMVLAWVRATT